MEEDETAIRQAKRQLGWRVRTLLEGVVRRKLAHSGETLKGLSGGNDPANDRTHVACLQIGEVVAGYHRTADLGSSFFAFGSPADDPLLAGTATGNRRRFGVRFFQAAVKINELTVKRFA